MTYNFFLGLKIEDAHIQNLCLLQVEDLLISNGKSLKDFPSLPQPIHSDAFIYQNRFIIDELNYDKIEMSGMHCSLFQSLTSEQVEVYENILTAVLSEVGGFFFLYGYGGTGKTFMWKTFSTAIRSKGLILLNVASRV